MIEDLQAMIWWEWSLALTRSQVEEAITSDALEMAREEALGFEAGTVKDLVLDDLSRWILGCGWPEDEKLQEDPETRDFYVTALYHMAEEKGVEVHN